MLSLSVVGSGTFASVKQEPHMTHCRSSHQMAEVEGKLRVCGGVGDTDRLASSEVFDLVTNTWSNLIDMPEKSWYFGLIPVGAAVLVLGGVTRFTSNDISATLSDAVSLFNCQTQQWTSLPRLPIPLSSVQAVYRNGSLWVLAAVTGQMRRGINPGRGFLHRLDCVLEYDIIQQIWITHRNIPGVETVGMTAYPFPL